MGTRPALAARPVHGIINGLDTACWDPAADVHLSPRMRYSRDAASTAAGKAAAKAWLQSHSGLPPAPRAPLIAFLGRLTDQKGVDLLLKALYRAVGPQVLAQETFERNVKLLCEQARPLFMATVHQAGRYRKLAGQCAKHGSMLYWSAKAGRAAMC
jgi:glycosyltransferase involved in cell wall biosynthesis